MTYASKIPNGLIEISYPTRESQLCITPAEFTLISTVELNTVTAIKFIRAQYNLGLFEAKQVVDTARAHKMSV